MFKLTSRPGGIEGMLRDNPREPLFSLSETTQDPETGKDVTTEREYTIPVEYPPTVAMLYANVLGTAGAEQATTWAMRLSLGEDGWAALMSADIPRETFVRMVAVVIGKIQGLDVTAAGAAAPDPKAQPTAGD